MQIIEYLRSSVADCFFQDYQAWHEFDPVCTAASRPVTPGIG